MVAAAVSMSRSNAARMGVRRSQNPIVPGDEPSSSQLISDVLSSTRGRSLPLFTILADAIASSR